MIYIINCLYVLLSNYHCVQIKMIYYYHLKTLNHYVNFYKYNPEKQHIL